MSAESLVSVRKSVLIGAGATLLAIGVGAGYILFAAAHDLSAPGRRSDPTSLTGTNWKRQQGSDRWRGRGAHVFGGAVARRDRAGESRCRRGWPSASPGPGVVEPNAYKRVVVTPIVAGQWCASSRNSAGVSFGKTIAQIYSPELAEAQASYVAAHAALGAHDRELARTTKLVQIGSASREELERSKPSIRDDAPQSRVPRHACGCWASRTVPSNSSTPGTRQKRRSLCLHH